MNTFLMNQPFNGQFGDYLIDCLENASFSSLDMVVAFAKNSGVLRLKEAFETFRSKGSKINVLVGIDLNGTSYEALTNLLTLTDSLWVAHTESDQTFHSKIYSLSGNDGFAVAVGSNNLTAGGLWTNFESCLICTGSDPSQSDDGLASAIKRYVDDLSSNEKLIMHIGTQADIECLLEAGYVENEVRSQLKRRKQESIKRAERKKQLFAKGLRAPMPSLKHHMAASKPSFDDVIPSHTISTIDSNLPSLEKLNDEGETIWFETRRMTGGSRNILDLSRSSLVLKGDPSYSAFSLGEKTHMKGGVQFFDVDPDDGSRQVDIVINFKGVNYLGNTIKFPRGDKANGTWRLQIKGTDDKGNKITSALPAGSLVEKIIAFTKVSGSTYFLTIFDSSELNSFIECSKLVAYNGGNKLSRLMGIL